MAVVVAEQILLKAEAHKKKVLMKWLQN